MKSNNTNTSKTTHGLKHERDEIVDTVRGVLKQAKDFVEYKKICEEATKRNMGSEENPYK